MGYPSWYDQAAREHHDALYNAGNFVTTREAARILGRSASTASLFLRWFREQVGGGVQTQDEAAVHEGATWTDERSGTVFTDLGPDYGMITFTQGEFRSIRRDYSKHYGGKGISQSDLAIRYKFPSAHAFDVFRRVHGLRQNSIPFTDEEIEKDGVDALVDKSIESKRQEFFLKLSAKEREAEKRDAEKWRALEVNLRSVISALTALPPLPVAESPRPAREPYALMISLTDLHLGKRVQGPGGEVLWDRQRAAQAALDGVADLISQSSVLGHPDEIMLLIASDGIQVDGPLLCTTGGTPMAGQTDGTYREMVEDYLRMVRRAVAMCYGVAPVRLLVVEGNHDRVTAMMMGLMLEQLYSEDDRVSVERQQGQGMILVNYAATTLVFLHGEALRGNKGAQLWPAITALAREKHLAVQPSILAFSGHLHHQRSEDLGGIIHHTLMALGGADEYHRRHLYLGSQEGAEGFVVRRSGGKGAVFYHRPSRLAQGA